MGDPAGTAVLKFQHISGVCDLLLTLLVVVDPVRSMVKANTTSQQQVMKQGTGPHLHYHHSCSGGRHTTPKKGPHSCLEYVAHFCSGQDDTCAHAPLCQECTVLLTYVEKNITFFASFSFRRRRWSWRRRGAAAGRRGGPAGARRGGPAAAATWRASMETCPTRTRCRPTTPACVFARHTAHTDVSVACGYVCAVTCRVCGRVSCVRCT